MTEKDIQKIKNTCKKVLYTGLSASDRRFYNDVLRLVYDNIDQQAEIERLKVQQPKVIQCKDCKFAYRKETNLSNSYECRYPFSIIKENHYGDFFCANAEPKAGEQE